MSVYTDNGYKSRKDYLKFLSEEFAIPMHLVIAFAQLLGPSEDFDGLVTTLKDYAEMYPEECEG